MSLKLVDRYGKEITIGSYVRVKECVGRYGQTQIVSGIVEELHPRFRGGSIRLNSPVYRYLRDRREPVEAGGLYYVSLSVPHYRYDDLEHGHETWIEVVEEAPEARVGLNLIGEHDEQFFE